MSLQAGHHPKPAPEHIWQLWGRMLRPSWEKDKSYLTPPARAKRPCMCQMRIVPRPQRSSSGCSQRSCINIITFLILMSFGFDTSWQRLPWAESSQLLNDS